MTILNAATIQYYYAKIKYKAEDGKWYLLSAIFPTCMPCSEEIDPEHITVCLDNGQPMSDSPDFQIARMTYSVSRGELLFQQADKNKTFKRVCEVELPTDFKLQGIAEPKKTERVETKEGWAATVGTYVKVGQEVNLDGVWSELEFSGWVARLENGVLTLDSGEDWTVEDGEQFVRNSRLLPCTSLGMPKWQRYPDKWIQTDYGWDRNPVVPKIAGCNCASCSLYDNTLVDVKERHEPCDILFVGEAPGYDEARSYPPSYFCGRAGQLLKAIIAQTSVHKYHIGYNNSCICHGTDTPTDEDIRACNRRLLREIKEANPRIIVAVGGVALQALTGVSGITEHQSLLMDWEIPDEEQVGGAKEGKEAKDAQRLSGKESSVGYDKEGRPLQKKIKLLPCFHSAAVLRRPDLFYTFAETIYKAGLYLDGNNDLDVQPADIEVVFADSESELQHFRDSIAEAECIYVDLETSNYNPYTDRILCVGISWRWRSTSKASRKSYVFSWQFILQHKLTFQLILECLPSGYWNAFFDAQFVRQNGIRPIHVGDVMLKHYTLDETPLSQGLKSTARRYCNAPDWEVPLKQYLPTKSTSFEVIPLAVLYLYNGYDAAYTAILDDIISERMDDNNRRVYDDILIPALQMFLDTCDVGMSVDTTKMSGLRAELQAKMVDIQKQLEDIVRDDYRAQIVKLKEELEGAADAGVKQELEQQIKGLQLLVDSQGWFNPSSIKDDRHLVFEVLGVQTDDMNSTSRTSLEDYKGVAGVNLLLTFRETRKLLGTYVEGLVDDLVQVDDKSIVHPNIRLNGTVTGRLSSANPNFFGIPDEKGGIKKLYLPRYEGWGIGNGDGAQMEVRALGALSNDRSMIEAFIKGVDFHGSARDRLYGRGFAKKNYTHQEVLDAKTAVFGPIYGRGAESLAQQFYHSELAVLKVIAADTAKSDKDRAAAAKWLTKYPTWSRLPREEMMRRVSTAQEHIDTLWEPYPTALRWLKSNVKTGQENGELVSYYGRYRHWGLVTEEILEDIKTAGRNFPVQSASSDTNLLIMIGSYHTFSRDVYIPIFPVHDSVVFMYKLGTEKWLFPQLKEYFERRAQELLHTDMKFEYEFSLGPSWGECEIWKGGNDNGAKTSAGATTNGG